MIVTRENDRNKEKLQKQGKIIETKKIDDRNKEKIIETRKNNRNKEKTLEIK